MLYAAFGAQLESEIWVATDLGDSAIESEGLFGGNQDLLLIEQARRESGLTENYHRRQP